MVAAIHAIPLPAPLGMVAHALGHPLTNVSVSHSTIRRSRMENCEVVTSRDKSFCLSDPLLLHWDAKLLPDIAGGQHKLDRVAVLVSGGGVEKLLVVPAFTCVGPDVALFKLFQKQWPFINREVFTPASDDLFISDDMQRLRAELLVYYDDAMKLQQPRDDYLELLHLSWTFLGGALGSCVKFRAPGAMHHA